MFKKGIKYLLALFNLRLSKIQVAPPPTDEVKEEAPVPFGKFGWLKNYNINTVIDVGANVGQFADKVLTIFPNATIHCFEPLEDVFVELQEKFKQNSNVAVYNYGLGDEDAEKEIFNNEYSPSSSLLEMMSLHSDNFDFAVKTEIKKIKIRKLNDFFKAEIDRPLLLKIDVQGYEMFVLNGGETVVEQADIIIIETSFYPLYKDQPLFDDIYQYLTSRNFKYAGNIEELISPVNEKVLQADAIFINKKFSEEQTKE